MYYEKRRYQNIDQMIESNWYNTIAIAIAIICDIIFEEFRKRDDWANAHESEFKKYGGSNNFLNLYYKNGISDHNRKWQLFVLDHAIESDFDVINKWIERSKGCYPNNDCGLFYEYKHEHELNLIKRGAKLLKYMISKRSK